MKLLSVFITALVLLSGITSYASYDQAPPDFPHKDNKAVFVDFLDASHEITYDFHQKLVLVKSKILLKNKAAGYPIFDLVPDPLDVTIDGVNVLVELTADPHAQSYYQVVQKVIDPGVHTLTMTHVIDTNVIFEQEGIASAFWLSDLNDRKYLEQYLPSNLEYDQHPRKVTIKLLGVEGIPHVLKANGLVSKLSSSHFEIQFPEFFTSSSVYFHLYPESVIERNVQFYYPSIDGRMIPVDIYSIVNIEPFVEQTNVLLTELERDYGPFPHNQIIIYGKSLEKGGMEYAGATATGLLSLGHELFHSYNARGVMPANGNSGWMDEAMARWRDNKYPKKSKIHFEFSRLSGHSAWRRFTDRMSYSEGSAFLSLIAYKLDEKGMDLKLFLHDYFKKNMYLTVTTEQFERELSDATQMDFSKDFNRYIYGKVDKLLTLRMKPLAAQKLEDEDHQTLTKDDLLRLTMPR